MTCRTVRSSLVVALCGAAFAFSSVKWLEVRNDDSDMLRLRSAYSDCLKKLLQPAENVAFPIESYPNGTVKSRLRAKRAQLFIDTGFIWGEGVRVEEYDAAGNVSGWLSAENCLVDRHTRTGWIEGEATLTYNNTVVKGRGVYFSFDREFIKIFSQSEIRAKGLKQDARSML